MDKQVVLKEILENKELKAKYWPEIDSENENVNTLIMSKNKYVKSLNSILNTTNASVRINELFNIFNIK